MAAPRTSPSGEPSDLSHPEDLVRRKAELRRLLLTRRRAAPGPAAAIALADRLLGKFSWPQAAVVAGYWPLADELDPRPCLHPAQPELTPDVVLVPLLGHRLGYGKGRYDRSLRALRKQDGARLAIGLAFALQELDEVPTGPADEALDAVVTERASDHTCAAPPVGSAQAARG